MCACWAHIGIVRQVSRPDIAKLGSCLCGLPFANIRNTISRRQCLFAIAGSLIGLLPQKEAKKAEQDNNPGKAE
jgi:hypothetical protein